MSRRTAATPNVEGLIELVSPYGSLISLYVDYRGQGLEATVSELLKGIKQAAETLRDRKAVLSVRADVERISAEVKGINTETAPAYAFFASEADGIFHAFPLAQRVGSVAGLGRKPRLRPMRAMTPLCRSLAAVVERAEGKVYQVVGSEIYEVAAFDSNLGKANWGGFQGYEEHRVRQAADEAVNRMMRQVADLMMQTHQDTPLDLIVLGGHSESVESLVPFMHSYVKEIPRSTFVADAHTLTISEIRDRVLAAVASLRETNERAMVDRVFSVLGQGSPSAQGVSDVLTAVNAKAVEHLLLARAFDSRGYQCSGCEFLAFAEANCPLCDAAMDDIDDVLDGAVEQVIASGGAVDQIGPGSVLDQLGTVALLRFPVSAGA